jgi:hypothetical protein
MSVIAVYLALFNNYKKHLVPGELATILILAVDKQQANIILRYTKSILQSVPMFRDKVVKERATDIELANQVQIMVRTCSYAAVRGYTLACAIMEEVSFWRVDGQNPDREVLTALRPGLATLPNSMLLAISSPYSRTGIMFENFREHYGKDDSDTLIWRAPTIVMNPTISQDYIEKELAKDPEAARAEWLAEFRKDIESFVPLEWIENAIIRNRYELPPAKRLRYSGFCDPSGGAQDSMTLSIGHREGNFLIQDVLRAVRPPFDPYEVVSDYANVLGEYKCNSVVGDKYAGAWVSEAFQHHGIRYVHSPLAKSEIYLGFEPLLARGEVELLDNKTLFSEFRGLERRTGRGRRDTVDHGPGQHDDLANATAGVLVQIGDTDTRLFPNL